jgi:hypothetical protein
MTIEGRSDDIFLKRSTACQWKVTSQIVIEGFEYLNSAFLNVRWSVNLMSYTRDWALGWAIAGQLVGFPKENSAVLSKIEEQGLEGEFSFPKIGHETGEGMEKCGKTYCCISQNGCLDKAFEDAVSNAFGERTHVIAISIFHLFGDSEVWRRLSYMIARNLLRWV